MRSLATKAPGIDGPGMHGPGIDGASMHGPGIDGPDIEDLEAEPYAADPATDPPAADPAAADRAVDPAAADPAVDPAADPPAADSAAGGAVTPLSDLKGQASDFEELVAAVLPRVLRLAARFGAAPPDAEDVAAEALARAYASWGRIGSLKYRDAWVLRTTTNLLYDRARRVARERAGAAAARPTVVLACFEQPVVDRAELVDALRHLSCRQRQAVVLHHLAGLNVKEVGQAMRASPNSVKKHLDRGMARLRTCLGYPEEMDSDG